MNKSVLLTLCTLSLYLCSCGKVSNPKEVEQNPRSAKNLISTSKTDSSKPSKQTSTKEQPTEFLNNNISYSVGDKLTRPANGEQYVSKTQSLSWITQKGATAYEVYLGTSRAAVAKATPRSSEYKGKQTGHTYKPSHLSSDWTSYYWRIDTLMGSTTLKGRVDTFKTSPVLGPEYSDYCKMLEHDIVDKKHGFLAGNKLYYMGGRYSHWINKEDETIGLTHPIFNDSRAMGTGLTKHSYYGVGADEKGWTFHKNTKAAYGTIIIANQRYEHPKPKKLLWRPDKMVCVYEVAGVNIIEEKFISENDVLCTIIKSDKPIRIEFSGQSYYDPQRSQSSTASLKHDKSNNAIQVSEGGTIMSKIAPDIEDSVADIMYTGMHAIISSDRQFSNYKGSSDQNGVQHYEFQTSCDSKGVEILWTIDDDYKTGLKRIDTVRGKATERMREKTAFMNAQFNYQIPYFRCSDKEIVSVYYYLYALQIMYYRDVNKDWLSHPHTQTAVNNFLGPHHFDYSFQVRVGNWMVNKDFYTFGNYLIWANVVHKAGDRGDIPEWMGRAFVAGSPGGAIELLNNAMQAYEHSSDLDFLERIYQKLYKPLYARVGKRGVAGMHGAQYQGAKTLDKMAALTKDNIKPDYWKNKLIQEEDIRAWFDSKWEINGHKYFFAASKEDVLSGSGLSYTRNNYPGIEGDFPDLWAAQMYHYYGLDAVKGFYSEIPLLVKRYSDIAKLKNTNFASTPDTAYFRQIGMFRNHVGLTAIHITLKHLKTYNIGWDGIPVAPEMYNLQKIRRGNQYNNFNAGKIILVLEGLAGLNYSIPDSTFTMTDCMPTEWDFMHLKVPIGDHDQANWVDVRVDRKKVKGDVIKKYSIKNNPLDTVVLNAFLEERKLVDTNNKNYTEDNTNFHGYALYKPFKGGKDVTLELRLKDAMPPWPNPAQWRTPPTKVGSSISMEAGLAMDKDGVQYYFDCSSGTKLDSGWQNSPEYVVQNINPKASYSFRVKTRDQSKGQFETDFSKTAQAQLRPKETKKSKKLKAKKSKQKAKNPNKKKGK